MNADCMIPQTGTRERRHLHSQ